MNTATQIAITGNTYAVKEELKALGARWNGEKKAWMVAPDKAEQAQRIVASAGKPAPRKPVSSTAPAPAPSPWAGKKYQVRLKPTTKYGPLFGADTLEEVAVWMDENLQWRFCGTDGTFQSRATKKSYSDVAVCTRQERSNGSGEYFVAGWYPCSEDRDLCHRVTPGRSVGMGAS